jgi:hypothetical protein
LKKKKQHDSLKEAYIFLEIRTHVSSISHFFPCKSNFDTKLIFV